MEFAKFTFPIPTGPITLEEYGKVIKGNINPIQLFITFKKALSLRDFFNSIPVC